MSVFGDPGGGSVLFFVQGKAQPAGSKKAYVRGGRAIVVDANEKAAPWKDTVKATARGRMLQLRAKPFDGPVFCRMVFRRRRPASHLLTDGVTPNATGRRWPFPSMAPDVLKLARAVEDAMTGVVYTDDALIVSEHLRKEWAAPNEPEGVEVFVMSVMNGEW